MTEDDFYAALYTMDPGLRPAITFLLAEQRRIDTENNARFLKLEKDQSMIRWSLSIIRWMQPILAAGLGVLLGRLLG